MYHLTNLIIIVGIAIQIHQGFLFAVAAVGCETFQDDSSLLILNKTSKCQESECWGEKEINVGTRNVTECSLLPNQVQYLHKDGWQPLSMATNSLVVVASENKVLLKVRYVLSQTYSSGSNNW